MFKYKSTFINNFSTTLLLGILFTLISFFNPVNTVEAASSKMQKGDIAQCVTVNPRDGVLIRNSDLGGGKVLGRVKHGDYCFVLRAGHNGFYYIKSRDGIKGYAHGQYLTKVNCKYVKATKKTTVYAKYNSKSKKVATLAKGEYCWIRLYQNGWTCVLTSKGVIGWAPIKYFSI